MLTTTAAGVLDAELTRPVRPFEMGNMIGEKELPPSGQTIDVALCIDHGALSRLGPIVRHLCVGLVDERAQVRVVTSSPSAERLSVGPVQLLPHKDLVWPMRRSRMRALIDALGSRPPSVVYAISAGSYRLGARLAAEFDIDLVVQVTSVRDIDALERLTRRPAAHVIVVSEPLAETLREHGPLAPELISLIRPGVLRGTERGCFSDDAKYASLVCTARLEYRGIADLVVDAARIVREHGFRMLTFLLGIGPGEAHLRKAVRDHGLSEWVTFARLGAELTEILRDADLFVASPEDQTISTHPLEAMTCGAAVISFEGDVADWYHDGETALVCKEATSEALAQAVESLLKDHVLARTLAQNARQYLKEHHSISVMAETTMHILRQLVLRRNTIPLRR